MYHEILTQLSHNSHKILTKVAEKNRSLTEVANKISHKSHKIPSEISQNSQNIITKL